MTALILVPQPTETAQIIATPFMRFVAAVEDLSLRVQYSMQGAAAWSSLPAGLAIASAIPWLAQRTAEKLGQRALTERLLLDDLSLRLDRILSVGITVIYGTSDDAIEKAAKAFQKDVLHTVAAALKLGLRPGISAVPQATLDVQAAAWNALAQGQNGPMLRLVGLQQAHLKTLPPLVQSTAQPIYDVLQLPTAQFFAKWLKQAREFSDGLRLRKEKMQKYNRYTSGKKPIYILQNNSAYIDDVILFSVLEENYNLHTYGSEEETILYVCKMINKVQNETLRNLRLQQILPQLPWRLDDLPTQIFQLSGGFIDEDQLYVSEHALHSRLLLAAAPLLKQKNGKPITAKAVLKKQAASYIDAADYEDLHAAFVSLDDNQIFSYFINWAGPVWQNLDEKQKAILRYFIKNKIQHVKYHTSSQLSMQTRFEYFLYEDEAHTEQARQENQIKQMSSDDVVKSMQNRDGGMNDFSWADLDEDAQKKALKKIKWADMNTHDAETLLTGILESEAMDLPILLPFLAKIPDAARTALHEWLRGQSAWDDDIDADFVKAIKKTKKTRA